jgi:hypothetical protein
MNKTIKQPTRFAPELRFVLRPLPPAPLRTTVETEFARLKNSLLDRQLALAPVTEFTPPLRRAANDAGALAWDTAFPLLVFPVLFEEKVDAALTHIERQAYIYNSSRALLAV